MNRSRSYCVLSLALALTVTIAGKIARAQTFSVLYDFGGVTGDPNSPGPLVQGVDGALYGTSELGGIGALNNSGTIFRSTTSGKIKVLYNFCMQSGCPDGSLPVAGLTLRPDGHFLGTAKGGGASNSGTAFDVTEFGGFTVLYSFTGGADGGVPSIPPIEGPDGNYYGTTRIGGTASACGTAYRLTPDPLGVSAVFTLLHRFGNVANGCNPSSIVFGTDGNLYGTTSFGGSAGFGTVFKMTRTGAVTLLYTFSGLTDGLSPTGLVLGNDGNFYGTAEGASTGPGVIFKITPGGAFSVLHTMDGTDGYNLASPLFLASDGNFYGAAELGGTGTNPNCQGNGCGTLFQMTPAGDFTVLYDFNFTAGFDVLNGPFQHTSGVLFGGTSSGGANFCVPSGCGVLYRLNNNLPPYAALIPAQAKVGIPVEILGQGFTSSTTVSFNGAPAAVKVSSPTRVLATVPSGATTGYVTVTTSGRSLTSIQPFVVAP